MTSRVSACSPGSGDRGRTFGRRDAYTDDGFQIAQADLDIRGPGEFLGVRPIGLALFKVADFQRDYELRMAQRMRPSGSMAIRICPPTSMHCCDVDC